MKAAFLYTIAFLVALSLAHAAHADDASYEAMETGNWIVGGCNMFLKSEGQTSMEQAWLCAGAVNTAFDLGVMHREICPPPNIARRSACSDRNQVSERQPCKVAPSLSSSHGNCASPNVAVSL
jgi:hypothetical protein